jgi:hypothetical protein
MVGRHFSRSWRADHAEVNLHVDQHLTSENDHQLMAIDRRKLARGFFSLNDHGPRLAGRCT